MKLYQGTNSDIEVIDLGRGLRYKDFGKGFYVTPDRTTAVRMAQKRARVFGGVATLITYEFEESAFSSDLKVKRFPEKASVEWFLFLDANRDRKNSLPIHNYFRINILTNSITLDQKMRSFFFCTIQAGKSR
jgi:hypothetical protein